MTMIGLHAQRPRRIGHALRVIAAGVRDNAAAAFFVSERGNLVISAAQFEGADGLQVFELQVRACGDQTRPSIRTGECGRRCRGGAIERRECRGEKPSCFERALFAVFCKGGSIVHHDVAEIDIMMSRYSIKT